MTSSADVKFPIASGAMRGVLRRVSPIVSAATLACGALVAPAVSHAEPSPVFTERATGCPEVQVVFARGTGEAPGAGRVGDAFAEALRTLLKGRSVAVYAVNYPASYDFLRAMDGVNDAGVFIQNTAATCPQTKMVLGGFSQGAAVVDVLAATGRPILGFSSPLADTVADHIAAVAVFGNPSNRMGEPLTTLSPLYGSKAIDLCNGADPVCSQGDDRSAHSMYVESGMTSHAAQFVAERFTSAQIS